MKEYIDRDAAIRTAIQAVTAYSLQITGHGITQFDGVDVANRMEMIPAADVVERVHGEWREVEDWDGDRHWQCSACGIDWYFIEGTPCIYRKENRSVC